ncbi:Uma2 family endonuclease [Salinactinospora qingdaonensis]|uniref:Uma2 family endonuclease n=1 Tax=Salinactinospora qingdaonensis TaxID=702744 RepID=A0ABP7G057_9ACTN
MTVMSISETPPHVSLPQDRPLTVDDLANTPDDGRKYELADGRLDVSAAPVSLPTRAEGRLVVHLGISAPEEFEVHPSPGMTLNDMRTRHRIPDVAVLRCDERDSPYQTTPPALVVEVVSPESVFRDNHTKRREYAEFGVPAYWVVSPALEKPALIEFRLVDGEYREVAQAVDTDVFETDLPFPVRLVPRWLVQDGPWKRHIGGEEQAAPAEQAEDAEATEAAEE